MGWEIRLTGESKVNAFLRTPRDSAETPIDNDCRCRHTINGGLSVRVATGRISGQASRSVFGTHSIEPLSGVSLSFRERRCERPCEPRPLVVGERMQLACQFSMRRANRWISRGSQPDGERRPARDTKKSPRSLAILRVREAEARGTRMITLRSNCHETG
jgi:hypothetical protein